MRTGLVAGLLLLAAAGRLAAQPAAPEAPSGLWQRSNLFGDIGGLRPLLDDHGITFNLTETDEVLGNPTGGRAQGVVYEGLTQFGVTADMGKAIGLNGGIFTASGLQIHGRGLTANDIANLNTVSGIEATRATRLFELWYQQSFAGGVFDVRIGQQAADQEFILTQYGALFINSSFGFPTLTAVDLPAGGPAYPLATPGIRFRLKPNDRLALLLGIYNGSPAGFGPGDPQLRNRSGTDFRVNDGAFVIGEAQYKLDIAGREGTYKLGFWYNSNAFQPPLNAATGVGPVVAWNNWSIYAVMDQSIYQPPGNKDGGLGVFLRVMGAPGDRNLVSFFIDGGVTYRGPFSRENDTVGIGFGYARISSNARLADAAQGLPIRGGETVIEATYQAQVAPWWQLQPDLQYIINPGGGILNPDGSGKRVGNALVLGLRSLTIF